MYTHDHHPRTNVRHWAFIAATTLAGLSILGCSGGYAQVGLAPEPAPFAVPVTGVVGAPQLTGQQLSDLTASIALYPDPLLAVMMPAATYPDQIASANQWLATHPNPDQLSIDSLPYDPSVKDLMHYPTVLAFMAQNPEWTQSLGMAFVYQQPALMDSIQQWRSTAMADNTLFTTPQEQVVSANGEIEILPAVPDEIFVPTYDPGVVFVHHDRRGDFLRFDGGGFSARWLDHDVDWHNHVVHEPARREVAAPGRAAPPARAEKQVFTRNDFHADRYPQKIVTPQDHRVITPTARAPEVPGPENARVPEAHPENARAPEPRPENARAPEPHPENAHAPAAPAPANAAAPDGRGPENARGPADRGDHGDRGEANNR